ncbi:hypothetical protein [Achromobacter sp.]|uniref:hypothetical protein n=1 Tax=Achromobacter sp. TaxID=134375 RepID=UPI00289AF04D|nr:hypothetical protein [Achromobacter sp.]
MYVGFELNDYNFLTKPDEFDLKEFKEQARGRHDELSSYLMGTFKNKNVIDARKISEAIFPPRQADIFLSHSRADENKAIELAVSLQSKGLNVFVDSCTWGYFHELLKGLNEIYAEPVRNGGRTVYDYRKATELTAAIHMMLTGALHSMIKRSEIFIFLNTENSVPVKTYQCIDRTFSPWIYSELQFSFHVEIDAPKRRLQIANESYAGRLTKSTASVRSDAVFAFEAFNRHLPKVTGTQMKDWYDKSHLSSEELISGEAVLDALYDTLGIEKKFFDLKYRQ